MQNHLSSSDSDPMMPLHKPFGRKRSIHSILGGRNVADVLLWRKPRVSAGLVAGSTVIWFLFEVAEYNFVTLLSHVSITAMLMTFIWCKAAEIFNWGPQIPPIRLHDSTFHGIASTLHRKLNQFLKKLLDVASGSDFPKFLLAIFILYVLSVFGSCFSFLNLLYLGYICMQTLPFLYERYQEDVDHLAGQMMWEFRRFYRSFDSQYLNKIPRGPTKEKKRK